MEQVVFIVIAAIVALAKWLIERRNEGEGNAPTHGDRRTDEEAHPMRPTRPVRPVRPAPGSESEEEERIRRFMEALGLPTTAQPPAPPQNRQPEPARPDPFAPISETPEISETPRRKESSSEPPAPPVLLPRIPPVPQFPRPKAARIPKPPQAPERKEPTLAEAYRAEVRNPLPPVTDLAPEPPIEVITPTLSPITRQPRREKTHGERGRGGDPLIDFSSPRALRRALVMAEVLGKPKGLQTPG